MSLQVSSVPEQTGLSQAAQQRQAFLDGLIDRVRQSPAVAGWMQQLRDHAIVRVQEQAFPTTRDEEWRFTDLSALVRLDLTSLSDQAVGNLESVSEFVLPEAESSRLVFVNGVYAPHWSSVSNLPTGVIVSNLSALAANDRLRQSLEQHLGQQPGAGELFTALNTAGLTDAAVVIVPKNQAIDTPIHLLFITTTHLPPLLVQPRCLVIAEANSAVTLAEEYVSVGAGPALVNSVTEIWVEDNAQVNHSRIQHQNPAVFHMGKTAVTQARSSRYTCNSVDAGAKLARHHLEIHQTGEQTETHLNGLALIRDEQLADLHSSLVLTKPYGTSRQLQKCIVDDRAHAVFNGKVFVPKAAQLTDAGQLNRNLLLSDKARVDTKPQLEIVADNVKCTHGATVGQLEADEVFYLQSRGIDAHSARNLLIYAFAYEVLEQIPIASLQQTLSDLTRSYAR